jgi:hypothetical protein
MEKVLDDLVGLHLLNFITREQLNSHYQDLLYLMTKEVLDYFEVQFRLPSGEKVGVRFVVQDDGSISDDAASGGLDYYSLPQGTTMTLFAELRRQARRYDEALAELGRRGWGTNGVRLDGGTGYQKSYSKDGYGVARHRIGEW